jgi:hypothetical protein
MKGLKAFGFTLVYNGKNIEHGIVVYEKGELNRKSVKEYGLEESEKDLWPERTKVAGKKLLYIHKEALRQVFATRPCTVTRTFGSAWRGGEGGTAGGQHRTLLGTPVLA